MIRRHLAMDVAYVSRFDGPRSVLRRVDAPRFEPLLHLGDPRGTEATYCAQILAGTVPELVPDTAAEPSVQAIPITASIPIGAHAGVPIRLADGTAYGMLCCFSLAPNPSLNARDLQMLKSFAEFTAFKIERENAALRAAADRLAAIEGVLAGAGPRIVYQPICTVAAPHAAVGYEALSRFDGDGRAPDVWFAQAAEVDRRVELELAAIARAVGGLAAMPHDLFLTLNAASSTAVSPLLAGAASPGCRCRASCSRSPSRWRWTTTTR